MREGSDVGRRAIGPRTSSFRVERVNAVRAFVFDLHVSRRP